MTPLAWAAVGASVALVVTLPLARSACRRRCCTIVRALMLAKSGIRPGAPAKGVR